MPPFRTWSLPASVVSLLPWQAGTGKKSTAANAAAVPRSYPDVLPKVQLLCQTWQSDAQNAFISQPRGKEMLQ